MEYAEPQWAGAIGAANLARLLKLHPELFIPDPPFYHDEL